MREHSAYYEATGPIVQEGFVAARVRALQQLKGEGNCTFLSHSPITPCPRPWAQTPEDHSHPRHAFTPTPESVASRRSEIDTSNLSKTARPSDGHQIGPSEASTLNFFRGSSAHPRDKPQSPPLIPELSASQTPLLQASHSEDMSSDDTVATGPQRHSNNENQIHSHRALPPNLADPSTTEDGHEPDLRPKRSIAARLGSMVERGWVGLDVFGKSYDRKASDPVSSKSKVHMERSERRSHSLGDKPLVELLPHRMPSFHATPKDRSYDSQSIQHWAACSEEEEAKPFKEHASHQEVQGQVAGTSTTRQLFQRSSSDAALYNSQSLISSTAGKQEERHQRRSHRLRGSKSHAPEKHETDGINSEVDRKPPITSSAITFNDASTAPSSRRSSTNTQRSARSFSGVTKWKLRWPKLVPLDKPNAVRVHSKMESVGFASLKVPRDTQQDPIPLHHLLRDRINEHNMGKYSHGDGAGGTNTTLAEGSGLDEVKERHMDGRVAQDHCSVAHLHRVDELQAPERSRSVTDNSSSPLLRQSEGPMPWWEQSQEEFSPDTTRHSPARSLSPNKTSIKKPSKRPSISTSTYGTFFTAPGGNSETTSREPSLDITQHSPMSSQGPTPMVSHSLEGTQGSPPRSLSSTPSVSDNVRTEDWPEPILSASATAQGQARSNATSPEARRSEMTEKPVNRTRASTGTLIASVQVSDLQETVNKEIKSSGKGVKRIQVTITFDGAADLVIDKMLDPQVEQEKKLEGDEVA